MPYTYTVTDFENGAVIRAEGGLAADQAEGWQSSWLLDLQERGWKITRIWHNGATTFLRKGRNRRKVVVRQGRETA